MFTDQNILFLWIKTFNVEYIYMFLLVLLPRLELLAHREREKNCVAHNIDIQLLLVLELSSTHTYAHSPPHSTHTQGKPSQYTTQAERGWPNSSPARPIYPYINWREREREERERVKVWDSVSEWANQPMWHTYLNGKHSRSWER